MALTIAAFCRKHKIRMGYTSVEHNPAFHDANWEADHYICEFRGPDFDPQKPDPSRSFRTRYSKGSGHHGKPPTKSEVFDCLASDASSVDQSRSFEDWASEMGYDGDSRKAFKIYKACERLAARMKEFLGEAAYEELLYKVERE